MDNKFTFVGFDGYNGDLTYDVVATLGVNCGMSTGRNGIIKIINKDVDINKEVENKQLNVKRK